MTVQPVSPYSSWKTNPPCGLEAAVGNTPLLPLRQFGADLPPQVQIYGKAEWFNPSGSVKDRPALNILRTALAQGRLHGGRRLLDSTSGNMGIAYATLGNALGVGVTLALPANASPERITILHALGAELILTDPLEGSDGAVQVAHRLATEQPDRYWYANQYDNPANPEAHFRSTGPEVLAQTGGAITHFIAGLGTTGTLIGVARYLRRTAPHVQMVAVQPDSPYHGLEGLKHLPTAQRPGVYDPALTDRTIEVATEAAYTAARQLARQEGLFVGVSAGAAAVAALQIAEECAAQGKHAVIAAIFPDGGSKYLSSKGLWE